MLRNQDDAPLRGCRSLTLLGHPICHRGFMKALGLGKGRFRSLIAAARSGLDVCPLDRRYMPKGTAPQSAKRSMVYDFLYYLYKTCGEELPDKHHSSKRPRHGKFKQDPKNLDLGKMRHLPPASFADYFRLCQLEHKDANISLKLFKNAETPRYLHSDACSILSELISTYLSTISHSFLSGLDAGFWSPASCAQNWAPCKVQRLHQAPPDHQAVGARAGADCSSWIIQSSSCSTIQR